MIPHSHNNHANRAVPTPKTQSSDVFSSLLDHPQVTQRGNRIWYHYIASTTYMLEMTNFSQCRETPFIHETCNCTSVTVRVKKRKKQTVKSEQPPETAVKYKLGTTSNWTAVPRDGTCSSRHSVWFQIIRPDIEYKPTCYTLKRHFLLQFLDFPGSCSS